MQYRISNQSKMDFASGPDELQLRNKSLRDVFFPFPIADEYKLLAFKNFIISDDSGQDKFQVLVKESMHSNIGVLATRLEISSCKQITADAATEMHDFVMQVKHLDSYGSFINNETLYKLQHTIPIDEFVITLSELCETQIENFFAILTLQNILSFEHVEQLIAQIKRCIYPKFQQDEVYDDLKKFISQHKYEDAYNLAIYHDTLLARPTLEDLQNLCWSNLTYEYTYLVASLLYSDPDPTAQYFSMLAYDHIYKYANESDIYGKKNGYVSEACERRALIAMSQPNNKLAPSLAKTAADLRTVRTCLFSAAKANNTQRKALCSAIARLSGIDLDSKLEQQEYTDEFQNPVPTVEAIATSVIGILSEELRLATTGNKSKSNRNRCNSV